MAFAADPLMAKAQKCYFVPMGFRRHGCADRPDINRVIDETVLAVYHPTTLLDVSDNAFMLLYSSGA